MSKKKLKIIGTLIAFLLCFPFHYVYKIFPTFLTSIFFPVNESIWEHMKILFTSIMVSSATQKIIMCLRKEDVTNICFSNFIGALSSIPIFLVMFLPIYYNFGENLIITISLMLISIIIAELISYSIMKKRDFKMENKVIILVIIVYIIFIILTYYPLKNDLFIDKTTYTYGINKNIK